MIFQQNLLIVVPLDGVCPRSTLDGGRRGRVREVGASATRCQAPPCREHSQLGSCRTTMTPPLPPPASCRRARAEPRTAACTMVTAPASAAPMFYELTPLAPPLAADFSLPASSAVTAAAVTA